MKQSYNNPFITTNQDYGSFYFDRLQNTQTNSNKIAFELALNDQVRNERRQFPSIAYDIMFDVSNINQPVISRRQLKYIKLNHKTNQERQITIQNAIESYTMFIKCIYKNKPDKNPQLSNSVLELVANELFFLNSDISADELVEKMIAITVPHQYLDIPAMNPNKPYPGTEADCTKTSGLQRILDRLQKANEIVADSKQRFDSKAISSQPMEGVRYIYNPFTNIKQSRQK